MAADHHHFKKGRHSLFWGLLLALLAVIGGLLYLYGDKLGGIFGRPPAPADDYNLAVWEWRSPRKFADDDLVPYMEFATGQNIKTIYLDVSGVIDINEISDPAEKAKQQTDFNSYARQFIQTAHRHGIQIHGLSGSVQWADEDYRYLPLQIMDYVGAYNAQASPEERFDGVQFDIEFYNQDGFKRDKRRGLEDYLATVALLRQRMAELQQQSPDLRLGFAIPYWFDNENGNLPAVTYAGQTKPVGYHLMDMLNSIKGGYVAIMNYRDRAEGKNGSIEQAQSEIRYAESRARNVEVVIGQLTNDTKPSNTTFHDEGKEGLYTELSQLHGRFETSSAYGGLAVHDFRSFKKLTE